jgi:ABC-type transporter Mla subunit MlaD
MDEALTGTDATAIGRIVGSVEDGLAPLSSLSTDAASVLAGLQRDLEPILADLRTVTGKLAAPGGTASSLLDADGPVNAAIEPALESVTGILRSLERTAEFLPAQLPQIAALLAETRTVLHSVEGLLIALRNNPILKKGFPEEVSTQSGGTSVRDIDF